MNEQPMKLSKRCAFIKPDGQRCGGAHIRGSKYCFAHDPERAESRRASQSKAGKARWGKGSTGLSSGDSVLPAQYQELVGEGKGIEVKSVADLQELMDRLLTLSFNGKVNSQLVTSITNAIRMSAKLLELEVLERRIAELEEQLATGGQG